MSEILHGAPLRRSIWHLGIVGLAVTFAFALTAGRALAATPGSLDTSFGSGGVTDSQFSPYSSMPQTIGSDVVLGPLGQYYLVGTTTDASGHAAVYVARYGSNGALDTSYGSGGAQVQQLGTGTTPATGAGGGGITRLAVTPQGDAVVASQANYTVSGHTYQEVVVMRLTPSGQLDPTFGTGGVVRQQLSTNSSPNSEAYGVALQPNGQIVLTGYETDSSGNPVFFAERLNSDGTPDPTFGTGGVFEDQLGAGSSPSSEGFDVRVQSNGDLVFAGTSTDNNSHDSFTVVRLTPSGALDPSFGDDGVAQAQAGLGSGSSEASRIGIQSNGDYVLGGEAADANGESEFAAVRFTPSGVVDSSFGPDGDGVFRIQLSAMSNSIAFGLTVQPNDRLLLIGGYGTGTGGTAAEAIVRLTANGTLDPSFGSNGVAQPPVAAAGDTTIGLGGAITPDGQLVTVGADVNTAGPSAVAYLAKVVLDPPPVAAISYTPAAPVAGQAVTFTAHATPSPSETIASIGWNLGSGHFTDATGPTATKTFAAAGSYTVQAQVTDDNGVTTTVPVTVNVGAAPAPPKLTARVTASKNGQVSVTVGCSGAAGSGCSGSAQLSTLEKLSGSKVLAVSARKAKKPKTKRKRVTIASKRFTVATGKTLKLTLPLNATGKRLLARFHKLPATLKLTLNTKPAQTITKKVTITPKTKAKRKHKKHGTRANATLDRLVSRLGL